MSTYGGVPTQYGAMPQQQPMLQPVPQSAAGSGIIGGGMAGWVLFLTVVCAIVIGLAVGTCVMGVYFIFLPPGTSWGDFELWRIYFPIAAAVMAPVAILVISYYLEKPVSVAGGMGGYFDQGIVNIVYFAGTVFLGVLCAYLSVCIIWYGVENVANCASDPLCNNNEGTKPGAGAIMLLTGWCVTVVASIVAMLAHVYVWWSARQVIIMAALSTNQLFMSQIGSEVSDEDDDQEQSSAVRGVAL